MSADVVIARYRYRAYPTPSQRQMLSRTFGSVRVVYNDFLRAREEAHARGDKLTNAQVQKRVITDAKLTPERAWLAEVSSVALIQACGDARRGYQYWFDSMSGRRQGRSVNRPHFRSKKSRQVIRLTRNGFSVTRRGVRVAKTGEITLAWSRDLPSPPSSVSIILEPDGRYYASFVVRIERRPLPAVSREVGIDLGLQALVTVSDGTKVSNPRWRRASQRKIARLQRALDRKQRSSCNRAKARRRLAVAHRKVREARQDHHHKLALQLVRDNQTVYGMRTPGRIQKSGHQVLDVQVLPSDS